MCIIEACFFRYDGGMADVMELVGELVEQVAPREADAEAGLVHRGAGHRRRVRVEDDE